MKRRVIASFATLLALGLAAAAQEWPQWGKDPQHTGITAAAGQPARNIIADIVYDPFVPAEQAAGGGDLFVHYQTPLIAGDDIYMEFKSGEFTTIPHWETQIWNEKRLHWEHGQLVEKWNFETDWKPVPYGSLFHGPAWEPVFHPALAGNLLYVPGAGGSVFKLDRTTGAVLARVNPFGPAVDRDTFTAGPLTADVVGNIYYNAIRLAHGQGWNADVVGSWLVKIAPNGSFATAAFTSLVPDAPLANDKCVGTFATNTLPWPPSPDAEAPLIPCGTQRPGINVAPAVAPDGTIYTVSVAHLTSRTAYLIAVNPNLTPKWAASLRDRFHDGCDVLIPPSGTPGGCRAGAHLGVDPAQNRPGAGRILDDSTASPTIGPDGSIFLGTYTRFNYAQGHLMKFSSAGVYQGAYEFGWDITPSIYVHDGTYSVVTKDNRYGEEEVGSYCEDPVICPPDRNVNNPSYPEAYYITQISKDLVPEWKWQNTNPLSCSRDANGQITCVSDHTHGFEWCVNAAAVDRNGNVFANSEDGNLYVIQQGGVLRDSLFLQLAIGAAYTPLSIGSDGKIYTQNAGHLFVVGR